MKPALEIIYLYHSGFAVKLDKQLLIFDYYQDPSNSLAELLQQERTVQVFSSHCHEDHFNPIIGTWQNLIAAYYFSEDIRNCDGAKGINDEKVLFLKPYDMAEANGLNIAAFGSTDEGVSFLIEIDNWRIFHAGDLNWWHWKGETAAKQQIAADKFKGELELLAGLELDVAFFPVDSRLEEYRSLGVQEFCHKVKVNQLIAMHTCGEAWSPAEDFSTNDTVAVWCPSISGERLVMAK